MLTKKQKQILDYITKYIKKNEYAPSLEEIGRHFKLSSVATVHEHVKALKSKGYLKKTENKPRSIELNKKQKTSGLVSIPLLGTIAAGSPIEAIENKETIAIPKNKLPKNSEVYALRVQGDSMIDEKINDGDIILIRRQEIAENGEKVVALIDNCSATLKKFYKEKDHIRLQPANKSIEPIILGPDRDIMIQGVVIDIVKTEEPTITTLPQKQRIKKIKKTHKKLPLNKIICNDSIKELQKLPDASCDIVIADPPYNIGKDFGNNNTKQAISQYVSWSKKWIDECIRVMKPGATMFIYGFSEILAHLSVEIPLNKRWLIWHYTNKNVPSLNFWQRSHEAIICSWKNDKPTFNRDEVREPYTAGFLNGAAGKTRAATIGRFSRSGKTTVYKAHAGGALPRDVIKIPALAGGAGMSERWFLCKTCNDVFHPKELKTHKDHSILKHPTQKPIELSRKLIKSCVNKKNATILVPFAGSGSECVAAKELGHFFIGYEINPEYIRIANRILEEAKYQKQLV